METHERVKLLFFLLFQTAEEWKDAACLAGSPLPYDFFGRLIEAADSNGRSGTHKRRALNLGSPASSRDRDISGLIREIK